MLDQLQHFSENCKTKPKKANRNGKHCMRKEGRYLAEDEGQKNTIGIWKQQDGWLYKEGVPYIEILQNYLFSISGEA